jgi:hypothetical protein
MNGSMDVSSSVDLLAFALCGSEGKIIDKVLFCKPGVISVRLFLII